MKKISLFLSLFIATTNLSAQTYAKENITLVGHIDPNPTISNTNKYSGCWGWFQAGKNREYAISGANNGTYFIDVTNPATPVMCDFVASKSICTWREMKTYSHYAYIVSDVCQPNAFQIVDLQYLPDSVHVVHNDTTLITLGHTIWIDKDRMWVASTRFNSTSSSPMTVWSLANPEAPVLLRKIEQDVTSISEVHDMYVRNDTAYVSAGWLGLRQVIYNPTANKFTQVGSYIGYPEAGYNHSSSLTKNGKYLMFLDEVPESKPIHFVDVQNLANVQPVKSWHPYPKTTPHNPFIIGNEWAVVSAYQDGLIIYNIANPAHIRQVGFFDTFYQGGINTATGTTPANYGGSPYQGNWGAYPYLPSGKIIANDMANGVFILDASAAFANTAGINVGLRDLDAEKDITLYPNPAGNFINVTYHSESSSLITLQNILGQTVYQKHFAGDVNERLDLDLDNGTYIVTITGNFRTVNKKVIVSN